MIKRVTIILLMLIAAAAMQARDFDDIKNAMRLIDSGKDSIAGVMQRLKASEMRLRDADPVKAAIYQTLLAHLQPDDSVPYRSLAMSHADLLAQAKATKFKGVVQRLPMGRYFGDDLLSVVGYELEEYATLHDYYDRHGNRPATILTALQLLEAQSMPRPQYIASLDSLMGIYGDLEVSAEVALARYQAMNYDYSAKEKGEYLEKALSKYEHYWRVDALKDAFNTLCQSKLEVRFQRSLTTSADSLTFITNTRNIRRIDVDIYSTNMPPTEVQDAWRVDDDDINEYKKEYSFKHIKHDVLAINDANRYETFTHGHILPPMDKGVYLLRFRTTPPIDDNLYVFQCVSDLRTLSLDMTNGKQLVTVVNAISGKPVPHAQLYDDDFEKLLATTNAQGEALVDDNLDVCPATADDRFCYESDFSRNYPTDHDKTSHLNVMTDRAIYRPGQDIQLAVLAYTRQGDDVAVLTGKAIEVKLLDSKRQTVDTAQVVTDEHGVAHARFALKPNLLHGAYRIEAILQAQQPNSRDVTGIAVLRVEQYKRPTFKITIDDNHKRIARGDTVMIAGQATTMTGTPLHNATVTYRLDARMPFQDTISTDSEGRFKIAIPTGDQRNWYYRLTIQVTDMTGESHDEMVQFSVSGRPVRLTSDAGSVWWIEQAQLPHAAVTYRARNIMNKDINGAVVKYWLLGHELASDTASAGRRVNLKLPHALSCGKHELMACCDGDTISTTLIVYDPQATRPCYDADIWFKTDRERIELGTSRHDVHVLYAVMRADSCLERGTIELSDTIIRREFAYQPLYGDGIKVLYAWWKDGKLYQASHTIVKPQPDKALALCWNTFRDRLTPGQKEQWQLQVNRPDGTPADARVIAAMYDKSLDEFEPHNWQMGLSFDRSIYNGNYASQDCYLYYSIYNFGNQQNGKSKFPPQSMSHFKSGLMGSEMLISGTVVDENDEPIIGATVTIDRNSRVGTSTDINGKFKLLARIGDKLTIHFLGYHPARTTITGAHPFIQLWPDDGTTMNEVVVTGYQKVDKRLFTGTETAIADDVARSLEGRVAGVQVEGDSPQNGVRGATSIYGDARPLIVVDGVIVDLATQLSVDALSGGDANALIASMLPNISANDIRDFKILTDPSATAIYGARASAGVILINTVKGDGAQAIARTLDLPARENLNETAFFFPTLQTDEQGRVNLQYTLPESVTTWRVMTQAHTRDMCWGTLGGEVVASKQFMVQPNVPRFVRMGDTATITSRIVNTCDHDVRGAVSMQLVDTETDRVVYTQHQTFAAAQGESTTVTFSYKPQQSKTLLMCKVVASNGEASDGEQHYLPVLSQLELVTRTVPFTLLGKGKASIDLSKLEVKKAFGAQYTLEYTNNPAWLMMQALHEYAHPVDDCAACQAIAYFSLKTAAGILSMSPQVAQTMQQWRDEPDSVGQQSPLERNQELKSIVLAETPWVGIAKTETEQRQQLSKFLDQTALNGKVSTTLSALRALQNGDGSWSWFKGMKGSVAMTQMVLEGLVRVNVLLGKQRETQYMMNSGFNYLARQGIDERYLYLAAMDNRDVPDSCRREGKKIIKAMKRDKSWHSAYADCIMATTLWKWGEKKAARQRLDAVMADMLSSKALGRYFDATSHSYWWHDLKIPTQVAAIEAMQLIHPDDTTAIEEMRRWLLQQKRTQYWNTAYNSANAVYAFINGNLRVLDEVPMAQFSVDGRRIDLPQGSAALGYIKTDLKLKEPYQLTVNKRHAGTSWGTVYAQFVQPSSAVEKSSSGISVKREIVKPGSDTLHVGDRVTVRLTITASRDLDFVQVIDKRPACLEPVNPLSGYYRGCYCDLKDTETRYYIDHMRQGTRVIERDYFIDRAGTYKTGITTAQCAYAPEFTATAPAIVVTIMP